VRFNRCKADILCLIVLAGERHGFPEPTAKSQISIGVVPSIAMGYNPWTKIDYLLFILAG